MKAFGVQTTQAEVPEEDRAHVEVFVEFFIVIIHCLSWLGCVPRISY